MGKQPLWVHLDLQHFQLLLITTSDDQPIDWIIASHWRSQDNFLSNMSTEKGETTLDWSFIQQAVPAIGGS